jgi:hypothetical protein
MRDNKGTYERLLKLTLRHRENSAAACGRSPHGLRSLITDTAGRQPIRFIAALVR